MRSRLGDRAGTSMSVKRTSSLGAGLVLGVALPMAGAGCHATATGNLQVKAQVEGPKVTASVEAKATVTTPAKKSTVKLKGDQLDYEGTIDYAYNEARLEGEKTFETLEGLRRFLEDNAKVKVRIEGHTDSRGTNTYNKELSGRRAEAIRAWLAQHKIADDRMTSVGLGEDGAKAHEKTGCYNELPKDTTPCEEGWALARKAVFKVTEGADTIVDPPEEKPVAKAAPPPPPPKMPEPEPPKKERRFLLGAAVGVDVPFGSATTTQPMTNHVAVAFPLGVVAGVWVNQHLSLGVGGELARGAVRADFCGTTGASCTGKSVMVKRGGLWGQWHFAGVDAAGWWLGLAVGYEGMSLVWDGNQANNLSSLDGVHVTPSIGWDGRVSDAVRLGPYFDLRYGNYIRPYSNIPNNNGEPAHHGWVGAGVRLQLDL